MISFLYDRGRLVVFLMLLMMVLYGCENAVDCENSFARSPQCLLAENDYVILGELVTVTTLECMGEVAFYDSEIEVYLMEYAFRPTTHSVKNPANDSCLYLWYLATLSRKTNHRSDLPIGPWGAALVYGNCIETSNDLLNVMQPELSCSMSELREALQGMKSDSVNEENLELAIRLQALIDLPTLLQNRLERGSVIYGTDFVYHTHYSFQKGFLDVCDSATMRAKRMTSGEYMDELISLVE